MADDLQVYTTVDKGEWGPGPWMDEPDKVQWRDEVTGLPCLAKRNPLAGNWCGYVGVEQGHPFFEVWYGDGPEDEVAVHGGLTFSAACQEGPEATTICHVPEPGESDHVWWLGFDCGHAFDFAPGLGHQLASQREEYRSLDYVRGECASLAGQLAAVGAAT